MDGGSVCAGGILVGFFIGGEMSKADRKGDPTFEDLFAYNWEHFCYGMVGNPHNWDGMMDGMTQKCTVCGAKRSRFDTEYIPDPYIRAK